MRRDSQFVKSYIHEIDKYVHKGYARELCAEEASIVKPTTWYLLHFGVVNARKPDNLRIVFDAAAKASDVSLNSALLKGPVKAQSLVNIFFKFGQGIIAVAGDIQEMFSQVRIRVEDQDSQRFLWRGDDSSQPIRTYAMTSMIFGAACSPCCAEYVKNKNAARFADQMPKGVDAVQNKTYVDDLVISFNNVEDANKTIREAVEIISAAGFQLRKFVSNRKVLEANLNGSSNVPRPVINLERQATADKILGMFWNTTTDAFEFHFKFFNISNDILQCKRLPTKRELLGIVMSIYDPFGLLANVTIFAKFLIQALWKQSIAWDDELANHLAAQWESWWLNFQAVKTFSIPRCYSSLIPSADSIQLHIFVDASTQASAAYLRVKKEEAVKVALVCAKSTCAPLKAVTVPRLELQAAILGCRIKTLLEEGHEIRIDSTTFWSDSQTIILWVRAHARTFKPFVAHRIAEILTSTSPDQWRWLPTMLNVVDEATRAMPIHEFALHSRWFSGPEFLHQGEEWWPRETILTSDEYSNEEITSRHLLVRYRSEDRYDGELHADELAVAENCLCRLVQKEAYQHEISLVRKKSPLPKISSLYQLTPHLDEEGFLRVCGRIDAAYCLPISARRPIILPTKSHVTRLVVAPENTPPERQPYEERGTPTVLDTRNT
ncbi:uncharacterized protein LOC128870294 [Anastrepha ludens]|uniref:uncharacterized protein LOC128870294 n=1 Tax=Anastrepha ludens TaxID=28586 RepID=UPI0023AFF59C|nr:uncharacterized protein LOC128870294 [Anastrepha ludens]